MKGPDIKRRLRSGGLSQKQLADHMAKQLGYPVSTKTVSRIVNEDRQKISVEERNAIESFFDGQAYMPPSIPGAGNIEGAGKIPLYGMAAGGDFDHIAYTSDSVLEYMEAPIRNVDAAFRVAGSSMEPRLFAGETVYVKLGVTPKRGDDTVVEMKDEGKGVIIKTFEKISDGWVFLRQWNPQAEIKLRWDQVRGLHAVRLRG